MEYKYEPSKQGRHMERYGINPVRSLFECERSRHHTHWGHLANEPEHAAERHKDRKLMTS